MYKKFLTDSNKLNANVTRKATLAELIVLKELSGTSSVSINTALYCIHHKVSCKKCEHCGAELEIENFVAGWKDSKRFCSIKCKAEFNPITGDGDVVVDYSVLLDNSGNPSSGKLSKFMNANTVKDLQEKTGLTTDDISTLLYAAMHSEFVAKTCIECGTILHIHNFKMGYRKDQAFCSYVCKDKNEQYKKSLSDNRIGENRLDNQNFIHNVMVPWFNERKESLRNDYDVDMITTLPEYIEDNKTLNFVCLHCGTKFVSNFSNNGRIPRCPRCKTRSKQQVELIKYVESFGFDVLVNDRIAITPKEIDIYIPSINLGIEYDGFYWHDDKDDSEKYAIAESNGVRLVRVFEDEYKKKKDIVLSRISAILGQTSNKIYARKCTVSEISSSELELFMTENHIQGNVHSSVRIGLFHSDILVAVMSFGKSRYDNAQWELLRFANIKNTTVVGGASKLFSYFQKNYTPESVTSYCDLRYGNGGMYTTLGFVLSGRSQPNYFYYKKGIRYSRIKFQKHKLSGILDTYDADKTETQNMSENGYLKIFDNGNLVFKWVR
jgi:very-short-patch-repair endonuclease